MSRRGRKHSAGKPLHGPYGDASFGAGLSYCDRERIREAVNKAVHSGQPRELSCEEIARLEEERRG